MGFYFINACNLNILIPPTYKALTFGMIDWYMGGQSSQ